MEVWVGSLYFSWFMKYFARPGRRFLNSIKVSPGRRMTNHKESLPAPFPIREFFTFRVKGKCGKALNQNDLFVLSPFRELRFKSSVNLNILVLDSDKVCWICKPMLPYVKKVLLKCFLSRCFCLFLNLYFLGWRSTFFNLIKNSCEG